MARAFHPPPEFMESMNWTDYKEEVKNWQALTTLKPQQQGPCLYLSLKGKAREAALELDLEAINGKDGIQLILERLDALFLEDTMQTAYLAYQTFENFKRPSQMLMKDYLVKFEQLYTKIKDHQMILPDGVLAYRVLNSANLTTDQMTLCRATMTDLKYSEMVKQLRGLLRIQSCLGMLTIHLQFNLQRNQFFFQEQNDETSSVYHGSSRGGRGWYRGNGNRKGNYRPRKRGGNDQKGIINPKDAEGNITRCRICESKYHWIENCPVQADQSRTPAKTDISLFQSQNTDSDEEKRDLLVPHSNSETVDLFSP